MNNGEPVGFRGNPLLKRKNINIDWTPEKLLELKRCKEDVVYFVKNYCKIVSLDEGLINFDLWDFQEDLIRMMEDNRFVIACQSRQSGKSTTDAAYFLHYVLFNEKKTVAILANKADGAREILGRLQMMYEYLPDWLQQGVLDWNKGSFNLENGSRVIAASTSSSTIRGKSINILFLDEFAFVPKNIAEEFMRSVYPTISSGKTSKIFIVSTPYGMNHYHKMWIDAIERRNEYKFLQVKWDKVPGRDEKWKEQTIRNIGQEAFDQEFDIQFIGSSGTLIDPVKIRNMVHFDPIRTNEDLRVFEEPIEGESYIQIIDTSEGLGQDASVCTVLKVSSMPYKQVAVYQSRNIDPHLLPDIAVNLAKIYNESYILCELNSVGVLVTSIIWNELEYENMLWCTMNGRKGQVLGAGFGGKSNMGLKTSVQTKRIGCSVLKTLLENDQLDISDWLTISEISTFVREGSTYKGQDDMPDDLVMTLVIFAWVTNQEYFRDLAEAGNHDIRQRMARDALDAVNSMIVPMGFIENGIETTHTDYQERSNAFHGIENALSGW